MHNGAQRWLTVDIANNYTVQQAHTPTTQYTQTAQGATVLHKNTDSKDITFVAVFHNRRTVHALMKNEVGLHSVKSAS